MVAHLREAWKKGDRSLANYSVRPHVALVALALFDSKTETAAAVSALYLGKCVRRYLGVRSEIIEGKGRGVWLDGVEGGTPPAADLVKLRLQRLDLGGICSRYSAFRLELPSGCSSAHSAKKEGRRGSPPPPHYRVTLGW